MTASHSHVASMLELHRQWACGNRHGHRAVFRYGNLSNVYLEGEMLSSANFEGTSFVDAELSNADITGAFLFGSNMAGAIIAGSLLRGANFTNADLTAADLRGSDLAFALFDNSVLVGCRVDALAIASSRYSLSWWLERGAVIVDVWTLALTSIVQGNESL